MQPPTVPKAQFIFLHHLETIDDPQGLYSPTAAAVNPSDPKALYLAFQAGLILRYDIEKKRLDTENPFFDMRDEISDMRSEARRKGYKKGDFSHYRFPEDFTMLGDERGLLGLAFHPQRWNQFFIYFSAPTDREKMRDAPVFALDNNSVVERVTMSGTSMDYWKREELMRIPQPQWNHNGGMIMFGPDDGYLYIGVGDGGGFNDEHGRPAKKGEPKDQRGVVLLDQDDPKSYLGYAQDPTVPWGKILRIDVDKSTKPYAIPEDNPFVGRGVGSFGGPPPRFFHRKSVFQEIYAYGLRNPWKFDITQGDGHIFVGDVGQFESEEITVVRKPGENHGWRAKEGDLVFNKTLYGMIRSSVSEDEPWPLVDPIMTYGRKTGRAVIGGYVIDYGTKDWKELEAMFPYPHPERVGYSRGRFYVFGDWTGKIMLGAETVMEFGIRKWKWTTLFELKDRDIHSFAKDLEGRLYVLHKTSFGKVKRGGPVTNTFGISRLVFGGGEGKTLPSSSVVQTTATTTITTKSDTNTGSCDGTILSPVNGKIRKVEKGSPRYITIYIPVEANHDVHAPVTGTIESMDREKGSIRRSSATVSTFQAESGEIGRLTIGILTPDGTHVSFFLEVGKPVYVTDRIRINRGLGDKVKSGEVIGEIILGSLARVYLPPGSALVPFLAKGDQVVAGQTVLAIYSCSKNRKATAIVGICGSSSFW